LRLWLPVLCPAADQQLARGIYKQLIEVKSGFNTGATSPGAEAMAERLRGAGFLPKQIYAILFQARPPAHSENDLSLVLAGRYP
jgi:hypothetical protein